jgi:hypothetical protein
LVGLAAMAARVALAEVVMVLQVAVEIQALQILEVEVAEV